MSALEELMARAPKEWRTDVERMMAAFQKGGASMPQLLDLSLIHIFVAAGRMIFPQIMKIG